MNITPWRSRQVPSLIRSDLETLLNRFFEDGSFDRLPAALQATTQPRIDVSETDKTWTVSAELPGLEEKDIKVQLMGNQLVISGERKWEEEKKNKDYHRVECQYGAFERSIRVPDNVRLDPDAVSAKYKRGMLDVTLQKVEPTRKADIKVTSG